jgi:uncharacterized protein DUF1629
MIDPRNDTSGFVATVRESRSGAGAPARSRTRHRKFYIVRNRAASRASGFEVLNRESLFKEGPPTFLPPLGQRGFRAYPERPVFVADPKFGRLYRDLEGYSGYWFISEKMKSVLQEIDPEAFAFLECEVRSPDGNRQPSRWLCDVIRVLDALDETQSTVRVGVADDGSKYYRMGGGDKLVFKESVVGDARIFRMKYFDANIICDEELRKACKSTDLKGISFADQSK